jgi:hypothetical protein
MVTSPQQWHLSPGDSILRRELHRLYGGSRQGGTTPSRSSPNILLFLDHEVGSPHGYFDGWVADRFYYTGHGQKGISSFVRAMRRSCVTEKMVAPSGFFEGLVAQ